MRDSGSTQSVEQGKGWASIYTWLLAGSLLTILAMWLHPHLPERRLQLLDGNHQAHLHVDSQNQVEWLDMDAFRWRCRISESYRESFCGFALFLDYEGQNFTHYTEIRWRLNYEGSARSLRYFFRNREPGFSEFGNEQTYKFMQSLISVGALDTELTIDLIEFYVAEWWLSAFDVPRALTSPSFDNIAMVGVDLPHPSPEGDHSFQLHGLELAGPWVSREGWYAGILTTWLSVLIIAGLAHFVQLRRRVIQERQRRALFAESNRQLQSQSDQYRELSRLDQLTGLLNRHGLTEAIEQLFASPEAPVSLLVLDIDHFKPLNDNHGHDVGDQILRELSALLLDNVRQTDFAARWGGEEFVIMLPATSLGDAETIAEKLRKKVEALTYEALPGQTVTVSLGVGERQAGEAYHELFKRVDQALYRAKEGGRNRVMVAHS